MDVGTVLLSITGSGGMTAIITSVLSIPKANRSELREQTEKVAQLRTDLTKCEGHCAEARDDARRARIETDDWRRRVQLIEEEKARYRSEADYWRQRWERDQEGSTGA